MTVSPGDMQEGTRYRVRFMPGREVVAGYLGDSAWGYARFDLYPLGGRAGLMYSQMLSVEATDAPTHLPRKVRT
jgi:hypothetical protein